MDLGTVSTFRRAESRDDLDLAPGEVLLGGGTWLFSEPQPETRGLVDLTTLDWPAWEATPGGLRIGATCTIAELLAVPPEVLCGAADLVRASAEALLMSFKIQHVATVGGNLCLALPAGAMIGLTAALGAEVVVWTADGGERREPVADFVRGVRQTSLRSGEVLRAVELPAAALAASTAIRHIALTPHGRSSSVVIGRVDGAGVVLTVTAATTRPVVLGFESVPMRATVKEALRGVDCWYDDPHGPADWRAEVSAALAAEVCAELAGAER